MTMPSLHYNEPREPDADSREVHWLDESLFAMLQDQGVLMTAAQRRFAVNVAGAIRSLERQLMTLEDRQHQTAAQLRIIKRSRPGLGSGPLFEGETLPPSAARLPAPSGRRTPPPPPGLPQPAPPRRVAS